MKMEIDRYKTFMYTTCFSSIEPATGYSRCLGRGIGVGAIGAILQSRTAVSDVHRGSRLTLKGRAAQAVTDVKGIRSGQRIALLWIREIFDRGTICFHAERRRSWTRSLVSDDLTLAQRQALCTLF